MRQGSTKRGSVLLMVIGLLTVIAMLGSMLLLVSRLDRQTAQALADVAPEYSVAEGILDRLLRDRLADLYIEDWSNTDPNDDVLYGKLDPSAPIALRQTIDYPDDAPGYDRALACIEPVGGTWLHISDLMETGGTLFNDVPTAGDPSLVDTDGDGTKDARLFPTGVLDRDGGTFWAAVRMIDASGLLNANIAGTPTNAGGTSTAPQPRRADPDHIMGPGYLALDVILPPAEAQDVVDERDPRPDPDPPRPYDLGDMLALTWLGTDPSATCGRLINKMDLPSARESLTVVSTTNTLSPLGIYLLDQQGGTPQNLLKADPNGDPSAATPEDRVESIYDPVFAMLKAYDPSAPTDPNDPDSNMRKAAQVAVNIVDYVDDDNDPTRIDGHDVDSASFPTAGDTFVCGVERHPFVSKVFFMRVWVDPNEDPSADPSGRPISALELINPYVEDIKLDNYILKDDGFVTITPGGTMADKVIKANGGRFVIRSDPSAQLDPTLFDPNDPDDPNHLELSTLDTSKPVHVVWKHPDDNWEICIDTSPDANVSAIPAEADPSYWNAKFRDDRLEIGRYSMAGTEQPPEGGELDPNVDYRRTDAAGPKLGQPNPYRPPDGTHAPIYVRNGPLICLGDLTRILTIGPTETLSVPEQLFSKHLGEGGAFVPWANSIPTDTVVAVPPGCMAIELLNMLPYDPNTYLVPGMVNVNTAPVAVLGCLPGLAAIPVFGGGDNPYAVEIAAYRDQLSVGGRDYADRANVTGITRLRQDPGFLCAGEVGIPLLRCIQARSLPTDAYGANTPYQAYALGCPITTPANDDGIQLDTSGPFPTAVLEDPIKKHILYAWMSNQVTVRSNTFIAYIRVQRGNAPNAPARRYIAVIDRSRCTSATEQPHVLLFTELH